jgi:hypothetical protein
MQIQRAFKSAWIIETLFPKQEYKREQTPVNHPGKVIFDKTGVDLKPFIHYKAKSAAVCALSYIERGRCVQVVGTLWIGLFTWILGKINKP